MTGFHLARHRLCHRLRGVLAAAGVATLAAIGLAVSGSATLAQTGVEVFNGNWVGAEVVSANATWPAMEPDAITVAIDGDNRGFEAEWSSLALDDGALEWTLSETEFERADRPGYFSPEDGRADIFDGETQLWAFSGETALVLGRLQIDQDSGLHIVYTCRLTRTEAGLEATLTMTTSDAGAAVATVAMVRK